MSASRLHAIRLGDDYGRAILPDSDGDGDEAAEDGEVPQPRWHAGASALLPEDDSRGSSWSWSQLISSLVRSLAVTAIGSRTSASLRSFGGLLTPTAGAGASGPQPRRTFVNAAEGFLFVAIDRRQLESAGAVAGGPNNFNESDALSEPHAPDARLPREDVSREATIEKWRRARDRRAFERARQIASDRRRPLLVLCNKSDHCSVGYSRWLVEQMCERLGIQHATAGPRCFVHAATRGNGVCFLPEELRKRIYDRATADGPADAARGMTLRLESGSALRAISGGVIGQASATRLLEAMAWLREESRA